MRAMKFCSDECFKANRREWQEVWLANHADYFREYNARNADSVRARKAAQQRKRRAVQRSVQRFKITKRDLKRALIRANGQCSYCSATFGDANKVTWDHVVPITRGGSDSIGNLLPACERCNQSKNSKLLVVWRTGNSSFN